MPGPFAEIDLRFPHAGLDVSAAVGRQARRPTPDGNYAWTCRAGVNVRAADPATGRLRGASRPGLSKWITDRPWGRDFIIQDLRTLVGVGYDPPGGMSQTSQSGRIVTLVAVCQGNVYVASPGDTTWTAATNNTGETPPLNFSGVVRSAVNNQRLYFADGTNWCYYDPTTVSVETWTATAGTLPVDADNNAPRLICTWRGRTVLSGLIGDPQNWFMSKAGDPHDFDYAPLSASPLDAVAGNNAPAGEVGDVVTALIPFTDDVLLFGGDHTLYALRGDPMDGGRIDRVSDAIGVAWGEAWARDADGTVWFFSNNCGIYTIRPGELPTRVSTPIDPLLDEIDTGSSVVRLLWDTRLRNLHVFVTTAASPAAATHYTFEQRTGAWWQDTFADNDMNPVACCTLDGNSADDRVPLIGSWDGYVRAIDPAATDDDGTAIASAVTLGPVLTAEQDDILLADLQAVLSTTSGDVLYEVFTGETAEEALSGSVASSGTWAAGRNVLSPVRRAGHAVYVRLSSSDPWAIEQIRMRFGGRGMVRRRSKY